MNLPSIYLTGTLAEHRRGRILKSTLDAQAANILPDKPGIGLLFGTDFQENKETQLSWFTWSQAPGHTLLLIPPFKSATCSLPVDWEAMRRTNPASIQGNPFLQLLATEVQFEFRGQFQVAQPNGLWDDQSFCTLFYRKHPHSGIFAVTCLPLWSLLVLDHASELQNWLKVLHSLVGTAHASLSDNQTEEKSNSFQPQPQHFTLLLHLLTKQFSDELSAIDTLKASPIFQPIETEIAEASLKDLQANDLVCGTKLTQAGRSVLANSPYGIYAQELEAIAQ
jgi:hypothetical protein